MVNCRGPVAPVDPYNALKPCNGTRAEQLKNCNILARISDEHESESDGSELDGNRLDILLLEIFISDPVEIPCVFVPVRTIGLALWLVWRV